MDRRKQRYDVEMQALISEFQALKRKLLSKSEALLIISKDLDVTRREKDQYKLMAEKLRVRCQAYKRQLSEFPLNRDQASLVQMLRDMKNQKVAHQRQSEILQQKLNEALGDVKLLRERFARQRIGDEGIGPQHFPPHEREELVLQLESAKQKVEHYRQEYNSVSDEISELKLENKEFRQKSDRLNNELNFMLNGDKKRIIDIDALCMENKYVQERVKQCQDEKNSLHAQINKLKSALNARKSAQGDIKPGRIRSSGLVISPKQVKEILVNGAGLSSSPETVADLQSIAAALLETINDKNLALHHLRNTNKILGNRVAELERKLRTLEVAGLWSMTSNNRPISSTPKIQVATPERSSNLTSTTEKDKEDEFMSSLGSRLSRLTDMCSKSFDEYKLVSLTPESSGSDNTTPAGDDTPSKDVTASLQDVTNINNSSNATPNGDATPSEDVTNASNVTASLQDVTNINNSSKATPDGDAATSKDATNTSHATAMESSADTSYPNDASSAQDVTEIAIAGPAGNAAQGVPIPPSHTSVGDASEFDNSTCSTVVTAASQYAVNKTMSLNSDAACVTDDFQGVTDSNVMTLTGTSDPVPYSDGTSTKDVTVTNNATLPTAVIVNNAGEATNAAQTASHIGDATAFSSVTDKESVIAAVDDTPGEASQELLENNNVASDGVIGHEKKS